jgi:iron complex outermembrane receptor protein
LGGELFNALTLSGNIYHTDDVVLRQFTDANNIQHGYSLSNLSAAFVDKDRKTSLSLFVNNLGNKEYKQHVIDFGLGYMGTYGPPRTWGVRLSKDF